MNRVNAFSHLVVLASATIRTVLERINAATPDLFQIVVGADGRVLGTVTDGDIRRAMLRGVGLDDAVESGMHRGPMTGRIGATAENQRLLRQAKFLPVIDDAERLDHVLIARNVPGGIGTALVMAGGFGTRLGEATRGTPKPLLDIGGRPMIDRVLAGLEDAGVSRITVAVHYLAEQIEAFLDARGGRPRVSVIRESEPLGTAGALGLIDLPPDQPVFVVNGDLVTGVDYAAMHEFHVRHGFDGSVAAARHELTIPYGVLRYDEDGLISGIDEKPTLHHFVAAGIYYLSPEIVALVARGRPIDMPELLESARKIGLRIGVFPVHEHWRDVGRPGDLSAARSEFDGEK
ncbi:MAG: sugar phosphate nucleotidyltransferase [Alphaproteobacteria bacterium]